MASERERVNYLLHCSGCHQPDGSGSPESGIPDMRGSIGHYLRLPEGRAYLVQVPGTSQSSLNDRETATLLNWMVNTLGGNEVPADFSPYTRDEVTRLRGHPLDDVSAARTQVLTRLQQMGYRIE
jgi:mono/diheme cytochrome c family protein